MIALCPNCHGQKTIFRPPWIAGDQEIWTALSAEAYPCPTCEAKGWIDTEKANE